MSRHILFLLATVLALVAAVTATGNIGTVAQTANGPVKGVLQYVDGKPIVVYRGIPFAEPPVGNLRWKAPVPLNRTWTTPFAATAYGPMCPQTPVSTDPTVMSEDCLRINVWAPVPRTPFETFPVVQWIHGGAFVSGAPEAFGVGNFSRFAVKHRVIVVAASYRVSAFGFFSSALLGASQPEARGVYGLLDQRLALKWTQNNIAHFDGRPNEVTIYGQSAGGISVSLHSITPLNDADKKPLFKRAIASSGYADVLPLTNNTADTNLLAALNCSTVECLYAAPMEAIAAAAGGGFLSFQPTVGGNTFLPEQPVTLMADRALHCKRRADRGKSCNIFMPEIFVQGFAANEGTFLLFDLFPALTAASPVNPAITQDLVDYINLNIGNYTPEFYYGQLAPIYSSTYNPSQVLFPGNTLIQQTDDVMACNVRRNLYYMSLATKAYGWYFDSAPASAVYPPWVDVFHESDVFFVANRADGTWVTSLTDSQTDLAEDMGVYWNSIAEYGSLSPNLLNGLFLLPSWKPFEGPLDGNGPSVMHWTAAGEGKGAQKSIRFNSIVSADGGTYQYAQRCNVVDPIRAAYYDTPALDTATYR